jgi:hypothetical protein
MRVIYVLACLSSRRVFTLSTGLLVALRSFIFGMFAQLCMLLYIPLCRNKIAPCWLSPSAKIHGVFGVWYSRVLVAAHNMALLVYHLDN